MVTVAQANRGAIKKRVVDNFDGDYTVKMQLNGLSEKILNGNPTSFLRMDSFINLCNVFNMSPNELLGWEE